MILGPSLALGPDENTAPLASMYRRLVVVAGGRCRTVSIVGIAAGFHDIAPGKPDPGGDRGDTLEKPGEAAGDL